MRDLFGRKINYLRISITDRCNLYCKYCCPKKERTYFKESELITYKELFQVVTSLSDEIDTVRITGGEPLMREGVSEFVKNLKSQCGIKTVSMTTNGVLLEEHLDDLQHAGLDCVNVSLDTLNPQKYEVITGNNVLDKVLRGIDAAYQKGIHTKINCVLIKDVNENDILDLLLYVKDKEIDLRFIELMPIGNAENLTGISSEEIRNIITENYQLERANPNYQGKGPAIYYRIPGFLGTIGFISPMTNKFCDKCGRIRITANGNLKPCLINNFEVNIRDLLCKEVNRENLKDTIFSIINNPTLLCDNEKIHHYAGMYQIGG